MQLLDPDNGLTRCGYTPDGEITTWLYDGSLLPVRSMFSHSSPE